ncbi:hypothetical protein niasHT_015983 [Heterodera trifolii]|uniref:Uncharacterized protein n=1 Tax=Heterodera trifolii TaxID=157864 RepID=A0ABD2L1J8_9BILA
MNWWTQTPWEGGEKVRSEVRDMLLQEVERVAISGIDQEQETTDVTTNLDFTEENDDPFKAFLIEQSTSNLVFPTIPSPNPSLIDIKAKAAGRC